MSGTVKKYHEQVAEQLIEQLKQGVAPWQRPWDPGEPSSFLPMNPTTGKRYRGINSIMLMAQGRSDQRWLTFKQAQKLGVKVRKGERGTKIEYWKFTEDITTKDENGNDVKETKRLDQPRVFFATVFNAEQIEGLPLLQPPPQQEWAASERAEAILTASGTTINHIQQGSAFYRHSDDTITLPLMSQFQTSEGYYSTALHELGHWTGHQTRLNRDMIHKFGSEGYAKEELRAEIASMMLSNELRIGFNPGDHAAYVGSWIKVLQNDPAELFRAAAAAEKIQEYVMSFDKLSLSKNIKQQPESTITAPFHVQKSFGRGR